MVVGAGVVGRAWGGALGALGHPVRYVDSSEEVRQRLAAAGHQVLAEPVLGPDPTIAFLCVPTPHGPHGVEQGPLREATAALASALVTAHRTHPGVVHTVVVRSTVPPGTTDEVVRTGLEAGTGLRSGSDFHVAVMPEYLRQRHADNAAKIAFWNDLWRLGTTTSADLTAVARVVAGTAQASWDPAYGTVGGRPYEGPCLPKDVKALLAWADDHGVSLEVLAAVDALNDRMLAERAPGAAPEPIGPIGPIAPIEPDPAARR
jgi:UDPglucose 6-dehydrogenase